MVKRIDYSGRRFAHLKVIKFSKDVPSGHTTLWKCRCDCGVSVDVRANNLVSGNTTSCGCEHGIFIDNPITHEQLKKLVRYNKITGLFCRRIDGKHCKAGDVIGNLDESNGYVRLTVEGQKFWAHRLAWFYVKGEWPEFQVDHWDRNRSNNRWKNLRSATQTQNNGNGPIPKTNTSGFKGVTFDSRINMFVAQIGFEGKNYRLGLYDNPEEAGARYDVDAVRLFGEFARTNACLRGGQKTRGGG